MTADDYQALKSSIMAHEGLRLKPYPDTRGFVTIGYGHNLTENGITREMAETILEEDIAEAQEQCRDTIEWFDGLDGPRQRVLTEMAFNLGIDGLLGFTRMLADVESGHYADAAREMLNSKWAAQVGTRAQRLAAVMNS